MAIERYVSGTEASSTQGASRVDLHERVRLVLLPGKSDPASFEPELALDGWQVAVLAVVEPEGWMKEGPKA
jgi:hypothetical protein